MNLLGKILGPDSGGTFFFFSAAPALGLSRRRVARLGQGGELLEDGPRQRRTRFLILWGPSDPPGPPGNTPNRAPQIFTKEQAIIHAFLEWNIIS